MSTDPNQNPSSCGVSCNVTAYPLPSDPPPSNPPSLPPPDPPPVSAPPSGGGGSDDGPTVPDEEKQKHLEDCAKIYGNVSPKPGFQTNFTSNYGWSSRSSAGVTLAHKVTVADVPPPASEIPPGGSDWLIIGASTYFDEAPLRTDIYMASYTTDADLVKTLAHEWYHQSHDVPGQTVDQSMINEDNATVLGESVKDAYQSDSGAKCSAQ